MFGTKVEGATLKHFIEALEENYDSYNVCEEPDWHVDKLMGRVSVSPVKEGFDVELAIKARKVQILDFFDGKERKRYRTQHYDILKGLIPYSLMLKPGMFRIF
jgi:hypothetical protein